MHFYALSEKTKTAITAAQDFLQTVMPACLAWNKNIQIPNGTYIVAGWGRTEIGFKSNILLKLEVPGFLSTEDCKETYDVYKDLINEKHFCAGGIYGKTVQWYKTKLDLQ